MIIKLQPQSISNFWPGMKDGIAKAMGLPQDGLGKYLNNVLGKLLTNEYQCWILYNESNEGSRQIHAFLITRLIENNLTGVKSLFIETIYGYRRLSKEIVLSATEKLKEFARANNCSELKTETSVERAKEILDLSGWYPFKSIYRVEL